MKVSHYAFVIGAIALVLSGGCATAGYQQAGKTALSLDLAQQEISSAKGQLTSTFNALDTIMNNPVGDLRPLFNDYASELSSLGVTAENARRRAIAFREESAEYFGAWGNNIDQMTDPALRQQAVQRRAKALASYQGIEKSLQAVGAGYGPLMSTLTSLKQSLQSDLTPTNLKALNPAYRKARTEAIALQKLMDTSTQLMSSGVEKLAPLGTGY